MFFNLFLIGVTTFHDFLWEAMSGEDENLIFRLFSYFLLDVLDNCLIVESISEKRFYDGCLKSIS